MGTKGNRFILNGKLKDINAEEVYSVLTTPIFGKGVVYDVPNAKFMEQKKVREVSRQMACRRATHYVLFQFIKSGLATEALRSYVPLIADEVRRFIEESSDLRGKGGIVQIPPVMAQITIFTASLTLQGREVREKLDTTFADLYHALDDGFQPINFMLPWFPLPANRRRDIAQRKMTQIYSDIIAFRRQRTKDSEDMLWSLMDSAYKDGKPLKDGEIAGLMIALLMAGQHSSSVTSSWIMLRLAANPDIADALHNEQCRVFGLTASGSWQRPLDYDSLMSQCPLLTNTIRETLRLHPSIHSIMRKVTNPLPVPDTSYVVPPSHILLASPAWMGKSDTYFPDADTWDPYRWERIPDPKDLEQEKADYGYGLVTTGADSIYLPFGAGRHRCIGEAFAMVQLAAIVSIMVREFRFKNVDGMEPRKVVGTDYSVCGPLIFTSIQAGADWSYSTKSLCLLDR